MQLPMSAGQAHRAVCDAAVKRCGRAIISPLNAAGARRCVRDVFPVLAPSLRKRENICRKCLSVTDCYKSRHMLLIDGALDFKAVELLSKYLGSIHF